MKAALAFICLIVAAFSVRAAESYGSPAEMKGLRKIYVDVGDDLELRTAVIAAIRKHAGAGLEFLDEPENADLIFMIVSNSQQAQGSASRIIDHGRLRLVWGKKVKHAFRGGLLHELENLEIDLAEQFAGAYRKAQE